MKRLFSTLLALLLLLCSFTFSVYAYDNPLSENPEYTSGILIYKSDSEYKYVEQEFVYGYLTEGWFTADTSGGNVVLYNEKGSVLVHPKHISGKLGDGYSFDKTPFVLTVYSPDGKMKEIFIAEKEKYLSDGWSENINEVSIIMYAPDGRTKRVYNKYVEAERRVGWYTAEPVTLYSADGKTMQCDVLDIEKYTSLGWKHISFDTIRSYGGTFSDVSESAWYAKEVKSAYELGFIDGLDDKTFSPDTTVTVAQGITMASRIHAMVYGNEIAPVLGGAWYDMYVAYAKEHGFVGDGQFDSYVRQLKRYEMAELFYGILPSAYFKAINEVALVPDVDENSTYYNTILSLYKAGIIMGSDDYGTFYPDSAIKRSECAAIINRVAIPENRVTGTLKVKKVKVYAPDGRVKEVYEARAQKEVAVGWSLEPYVKMYASDGRTKYVLQSKAEDEEKVGWSTKPVFSGTSNGNTDTAELNAEQVYAKCASAVFTIYAGASDGESYSQGSGFFIDASGTAVTNYHVIENKVDGLAYLSSTDEKFEILGVYDYDKTSDWAVIKVDCKGNDFLKVGDPSTIVSGATVFAIGSPKGLTDTITQGIISNPSRVVDGVSYIQMDAAITHGNSGGALINKYGEVIGINSAVLEHGMLGLNFALPVSKVMKYSSEKLYTMREVTVGTDIPAEENGGESKEDAPATHEALVKYILTNGTHVKEQGAYMLDSGRIKVKDTLISTALMYSVENSELIIIYANDKKESVNIVIPHAKSGYKLSYYMFGNSTDVVLASATGLVYPSYSLSEQARKAILLETFDILGKNNLYGDKHNEFRDALGKVVALALEVADDHILKDTGFSIEEIYGLKR